MHCNTQTQNNKRILENQSAHLPFQSQTDREVPCDFNKPSQLQKKISEMSVIAKSVLINKHCNGVRMYYFTRKNDESGLFARCGSHIASVVIALVLAW